MNKTELILNKFNEEIPKGHKLDEIFTMIETEFGVKREELLEIAKPLGISIFEGKDFSPEDEKELNKKIVELLLNK